MMMLLCGCWEIQSHSSIPVGLAVDSEVLQVSNITHESGGPQYSSRLSWSGGSSTMARSVCVLPSDPKTAVQTVLTTAVSTAVSSTYQVYAIPRLRQEMMQYRPIYSGRQSVLDFSVRMI